MSTRSAYDVLDLKALRCFWAAGRLGSLTRAGIELGISEAAVSQRVKSLERRLATKLYETRGGRIRLTPSGEQTLAMADELFHSLQVFESDLASADVAGTLTVAAYESALRYLLPPVVKQFHVRFPQAFLRLLSRDRDEIVRLVRSNEVDVGLAATGRLPAELCFAPWHRSRSVLIIPVGHPLLVKGKPKFDDLLTPDLLERYPLIVSAVGSAYTEDDRIEKVLARRGLPYRVALEVGNIDTVKHYVSQGLGIAVVPEHCLSPSDQALFERIDVPAGFEGELIYGVILNRRKFRTPILEAFLGLLDLDSHGRSG